MNPNVPIRVQKKLLRSLGFGFLAEVPAPAGSEPPPAETVEPEPWELAQSASLPPEFDTWEALAPAIKGCGRCQLQYTRRNALPGSGSLTPRALFIEEIPWEEADATGDLGAGEIGTMLGKLAEAMKLEPAEWYATTAVRCRPPGGRPPARGEIAACAPYMAAQIALLNPSVIVCFGVASLASLLPQDATKGLNPVRGQWKSYAGIPVMTTFPLHYLLKNPQRKRTVWEDMQEVMRRLGKSPAR